MNADSLDLIVYKYAGWDPRIRPAAPKRQWMEDTSERYAYRCLPLAIANTHGWEILCPVAFEARWDGDIHMASVELKLDPNYPDRMAPISLFGYGTVTFHVEGIFRTPPGWNLWVTGSTNLQKDGIQALSGVVETDWSPYTFTMNWRFTRPNHWVRFEENEPIAFVFPVQRGQVERFKPKLMPLEEEPELKNQFETWSASRNAFQEYIKQVNPAAPAEKWQKLYYRGLDAMERPGPPDHQSKLRAAPFRFPDGKVMAPGVAQTCPMRHHADPVQPVAEAAAAPANALFMAGVEPGGGDALTLALNRIGFPGKPQLADRSAANPAHATAVAKPDPAPDTGDQERAIALKRRDWLLDTQARQLRLAQPAAGIDRVRDLSPADFLRHYYTVSRPVIIQGAIDDWPALTRWSPEYLAAAVGSVEVEYQGGRSGSPTFEMYKLQHKRTMPFAAFMARIVAEEAGNDSYITAFNSATNANALAPLEADVRPIDPYLTPGGGMMWIGPLGTFTPLHFDLTNNMIVQVVGAKQFVMAAPGETHRLSNRVHVFSDVHDLTDEDQLARYPLARDVKTVEFTLEAGEMLFSPLGWWHQVTALDFSVTRTYTNFRWPNEGHAAYPAD